MFISPPWAEIIDLQRANLSFHMEIKVLIKILFLRSLPYLYRNQVVWRVLQELQNNKLIKLSKLNQLCKLVLAFLIPPFFLIISIKIKNLKMY